jgi:hypothetical protein
LAIVPGFRKTWAGLAACGAAGDPRRWHHTSCKPGHTEFMQPMKFDGGGNAVIAK